MVFGTARLPTRWYYTLSELHCSAEIQDRSTRLLENVDKTGDIILLGKSGVKMAAHSAVLADIPYFWALLNKDWQGSNWNFHNKLKLSLPFDVTKEGLQILLEFLYIGNNCFVRRGPLDSVLMQELLSIAEACDIPSLCKSLVSLVQVDEVDVKLWLDWLKGERSSNVSPIQEQCSEVLQKKFQRLKQWKCLSVEELSQLSEIGEKLESAAAVTQDAPSSHVLVKLVTEQDIQQQIGKTGYFDLIDFETIKGWWVHNQTTIAEIKERVDAELGIPVKLQRYWTWGKRRNGTLRVNRPLFAHEEGSYMVVNLATPLGNSTLVRLFLEAPVLEKDVVQIPLSLSERNQNDIFLFFKLFDPGRETLEYVGSMYVGELSKPTMHIAQFNTLAGLPEEQPLQLFEEIRFKPAVMCEPIDQHLSFRGSQLEDGDIICIQKPIPDIDRHRYRFLEVGAFLTSVSTHNPLS